MNDKDTIEDLRAQIRALRAQLTDVKRSRSRQTTALKRRIEELTRSES